MSARATFAADYGATGAQVERLDRYAAMLADWQTRMNLVAASTLPDVWSRHFADSAQLAALAEARDATTWLDIGSGAGFPALVLALLTRGTFHLVEATGKKCAFLAAAAAELGVADRVVIHNARVEALRPFAVDVVTARACTALPRLFGWGEAFARDGRWLLLKGRTVESEIAAAYVEFAFDHRLVASRTDPHARIVDARNVRRRR